jgi:glycosyltransferase involved in cell wall biosynthesis
MRDVWLVIAAYNEAAVIGDVVLGAHREFPNIVVVDDCSSDGSGEIAHDGGAHVLRHAVNLGQGAALQTGITYALLNGAETIVTFDADGQHHVEDAVAMVRSASAGDADVILGSRFLSKRSNGMPPAKRLLLSLATFYTRLTSGLSVTDTHNGLRCFTRQAALRINIRQNRMAHASEILTQISTLGLSYREMPCTVEYTAHSRAKGQRISGAFRIILDLALRSMHR